MVSLKYGTGVPITGLNVTGAKREKRGHGATLAKRVPDPVAGSNATGAKRRKTRIWKRARENM